MAVFIFQVVTRDAVDEPDALTLLDLTANSVDVDTMTVPVSAGFDVHKKERGGAGVGENISKMRDGSRSAAVRVMMALHAGPRSSGPWAAVSGQWEAAVLVRETTVQ